MPYSSSGNYRITSGSNPNCCSDSSGNLGFAILRSDLMKTSNCIWIPQTVACLFLLGAFNPDNPYSYYIILRWVVCGVFAYLAYQALEKKQIKWTWILGITALIYNPIFRVSLEREFWSAINLLTILIAIVSVFKIKSQKQ